MRAALEIDPNHPYAVANLGHLLYRRGAFEEAAKIYRGIYQRSHDSEQIDTDIYDSLCLGLALQGAGRIDEARGILEREFAEHEPNIREGAEMGREVCLLAALGRSREAFSLARELEAIDPKDPHQLLVLAEIYTIAGNSDAAVQALERAFEVGFDDPYYILVNPPFAGIQNEPVIDRLAPVS